jgi:hypothetical protein
MSAELPPTDSAEPFRQDCAHSSKPSFGRQSYLAGERFAFGLGGCHKVGVKRENKPRCHLSR